MHDTMTLPPALLRRDDFPDRLVLGGVVFSQLFSIPTAGNLQPSPAALGPSDLDDLCTIRFALICDQRTRSLSRLYGGPICEMRIELVQPPRAYVWRTAKVHTDFAFDDAIKKRLTKTLFPDGMSWRCGRLEISQQRQGKQRLKGHWVFEENLDFDIIGRLKSASYHTLLTLSDDPEIEFIRDPKSL